MVNVQYYTINDTTVYHVVLVSTSNLSFTKRLGCKKENDNDELMVSETTEGTEGNFPETEMILQQDAIQNVIKGTGTKSLSIQSLNHLYNTTEI
jgi:hypothetical protein